MIKWRSSVISCRSSLVPSQCRVIQYQLDLNSIERQLDSVKSKPTDFMYLYNVWFLYNILMLKKITSIIIFYFKLFCFVGSSN